MMLSAKDIEEIVSNYKALETRLKYLKRNKECIEEVGVSALSYKIMPTKTNEISRITENRALKNINKKKSEMEVEIKIIEIQLAMIKESIDGLEVPRNKIVWGKLVEKKSYDELAEELNISIIYAKKLKREGIDQLRAVMTI